MNELDLLFQPRSIAVVGAAHTVMKLGGVVLKNLLDFRGKVYPVNPKYPELMGVKTYPTVQDIPENVDLAIILRPAAEVPEILRDFSGKTKSIIIMSSGFAEVGETALQEEVRKVGRELGLRLLGPNCMGVYNPHKRLDTFFLPHERLPRPKKGNVAVVSQSGAILSCVLGAIRQANAGVSKAIGYGNAIDISETDIYEYLAFDKKTDVVVSYMESIIDGRKFVESAMKLCGKKPLIILKSGKGPSGEAAAFSHTGRLAGRYEVFHSIVKQFGIREASDFDELIDSTKALSYQRPLKGNRVCIITNGGGSGVLAADECLRQGLDVTKLPEEKKERLSAIFPHFYVINNPVDLTAQVKDEDYITTLTELRDCYDGFIIIALPNVLGITEKLGLLMMETMKKLGKPVSANITSSGISGKLTSLLEKAKVPVYPSPERAVRGLKALLAEQNEH
jgi:acetate---CoA ligase (ADP-forming) subunit alpha